MAESDTSLSRSPQKCAYCQQKLGDIEQLKQLPCSHTACLECLEQEYEINEIREIKCPVCRAEHASLDIDSLITVFDKLSTTLKADAEDKYKCSECKDGVTGATGYCIQCNSLGCLQHLQEHESSNHKVISIEVFKRDPGSYKMSLCKKHQKEILSLCKDCKLEACEGCETDSECSKSISVFETEPQNHQMVLVAKLFVKKKIETLSEFDSTIDKLYAVYKSMWKKFDDFVDQNGAPESSGATADRKLSDDQHSTLITTVEQMSGSVLKKIEDVEKCKRETHVKMKFRPRLSIINDKYLNINDDLKRDCERVQMLRQAEQDKLGYILRKVARQLQPRSSQRKFDYNKITHVHTVRTSRNCYSVSFKGDGRIIAACDFGFYLCDEHGNLKCGKSTKFPTTAIELNEEIYYIDLWNYSNIKKCSLDLDNEVKIGSFNYPSDTHSRLAVSNDYLAVNEKLHKSILVHKISSGSKKRTEGLDYEPVHVFFHQDGNLLATDQQNGVLLSYRVAEDCRIAEEWRCTGLELASSICTDGLGNIFVGSTDKKVLYIVSKEGKLISELSHEELPKSPGGMSIQDNTLTIACISDGYKFFMFN